MAEKVVASTPAKAAPVEKEGKYRVVKTLYTGTPKKLPDGKTQVTIVGYWVVNAESNTGRAVTESEAAALDAHYGLVNASGRTKTVEKKKDGQKTGETYDKAYISGLGFSLKDDKFLEPAIKDGNVISPATEAFTNAMKNRRGKTGKKNAAARLASPEYRAQLKEKLQKAGIKPVEAF